MVSSSMMTVFVSIDHTTPSGREPSPGMIAISEGNGLSFLGMSTDSKSMPNCTFQPCALSSTLLEGFSLRVAFQETDDGHCTSLPPFSSVCKMPCDLNVRVRRGDKSPSDANYPFTKELTEANRFPEPFHNNHCYTVEILGTQPYWAAR